MDENGVRAFAEGGTVMHDDLPWAEFIAPRLVYERTQHQSIAELEKHVTSPVAIFAPGADPAWLEKVERRHLAHVNDLKAVQDYYGGLAIGSQVLDKFLESLAIDPDDSNAKFYLGEIARTQAEVFLDWGEHKQAMDVLNRVLPHLPDDAKLLELKAAHEKAMAESPSP